MSDRNLARVALEYEGAGERVLARLHRELLAVALRGEAAAKVNATTAPRVRGGALRRSIKGSVERTATQAGGGARLILDAGRDGSPSERYASAQEGPEDGGSHTLIRPKQRRFLAIPINSALTGAGVPRYRSPRDVPDLRFQAIRGGSMGLLVRDVAGKGKSARGARSEVLFLLVRSVRVPATRFLGRAMETIRPDAVEAARTAIREAVESPDAE